MDAIGAENAASTSMDVDESAPEQPTSKTVQWRPVISPSMRASSEPLKPDRFLVGYVYSEAMMMHVSLHREHPEGPERIAKIMELLRLNRLHQQMKNIPIRKVKREEALLVHSADHWDKVMRLAHLTEEEIIASLDYYELISLYVTPQTTHAALLSCGGVVEATLAVARKELMKSFAVVRPPGHHAEPTEHMGFCFFNNVAVATRVVQLLTNIRKILILDWDVHHGNGTQRAFNDDPNVLYISLHRYEQGSFYPCGPFGGMESSGEGAGKGFSVNIPWPEEGMGDADYIHAFQKIVMPIAMEFAPELVIISAGFDAAEGDPLGECHITPTGYAHMTHMLAGLAGGRVAVALEGGYNVDASAASALAVARVLLGEAPPELKPMVASEVATETVWLVAKEQSKYWKNVQPKACEPRDGTDLERTTYSIPEILKAHRQHELYMKYGMVQIPLLNDDVEERFGTQIMCTPDLLEKDVMIVLVHEFGNLRAEVQAASCDLEVEHGYLVDVSKDLISWVTTEGYSLIDVNLYPRPFPSRRLEKSTDELARGLLTYLWDNYIQISGAKSVAIIGHGPGCEPLIDLINKRTTAVMQTVRAVVQVVGYNVTPSLPRYVDEIRAWYKKHGLVIVPTGHPTILPESKVYKKHGKVAIIDEPKPIKLLIRAMPAIQQYVSDALASRTAGVPPLAQLNGPPGITSQ